MKRLFYGWYIVGAGGIVQWYTSAVFWRGFQAFIPHILSTFGWSAAATGAAISIQRSESGLISPFVGFAIDKFGPRKVMILGIITTGIGFIIMSRMQNLWHFYLSILILTLGMSFGSFIVFVVTVGNWFIKRRARALSILMCFSALGGITLPLLVVAIEGFGWRDVMMMIGFGFWFIGIPAAFFMRKNPENYGLLPDGNLEKKDSLNTKIFPPRQEPQITLRQAVKLRVFWQLAIATSLGQLVSSTNLFHFDALINFGISIKFAALAAGSVAVGDLLGRAGIAIIGDKLDKKNLLTLSFLLQVIGIGALPLVNYSFQEINFGSIPLPIFVIGFGIGFGASIPLRLALLADYFGRRSYGSILGITSSINAIFGAIGPALVGLLYDLNNDYRIGFFLITILLSISIPLCSTLDNPTEFLKKLKPLRK